MKYEVVPDSCRVCLRKNKKLRSIYTPLEEGDESPNQMLQLVTGIIVVESTNALPENICKGCELSLNLAFQFRAKALRSQKLIELFCKHRKKIDPIKSPNAISKDTGTNCDGYSITQELSPTIHQKEKMKLEELEIPFSDDERLCYSDDNSFDDVDTKYSSADEKPLSAMQEKETSVKSTNISQPMISHHSTVLDSINEMEVKFESLENLFHAEEQTEPIFRNDCSDTHPLKKRKKIAEKKNAQILCDKETKSLPPRPLIKLFPKKSGRPKINDESGHICDICGNIYSKRGRMMEHRRRHDKELRFACELCEKRFHLREELRKHMFYHSGVKPYQCSYCSRTFYYESVKKAHEAVHEGIKPYVCEVCNKAFAYSHALKKHTLIHSDIKMYHCDYCGKDFRLRHHMKQHEETKTHQNAVKSLEAAGTTTGKQQK